MKPYLLALAGTAIAVIAACHDLPDLGDDDDDDDSSSFIPSSSSSSSSSSTGGFGSTPDPAALDARLDNILKGSAPPEVVSTGAQMLAGLQGPDAAHLLAVQWNAATADSLLGDPVILRSMASVEPSGSSGLRNQALGHSLKLATASYTCNADCGTVQRELGTAVAALQRGIAGAGRFGAASCTELAQAAAATEPATICAGILAYLLDRQVLALYTQSYCFSNASPITTQTYGSPGSMTALDESCAQQQQQCAPQTRCAQGCTDLQSDPFNCGQCGQPCGERQCSEGRCCMPPGERCSTSMDCCSGGNCNYDEGAQDDAGAPVGFCE